MASGYNRVAEEKRATNVSGGGTKIFLSNPLFNGVIKDMGYGLTTILLTSNAKLDDEYFTVTPYQDYIKSEQTVSGDLVNVLNPSRAKVINARMFSTTKSIPLCDPVACVQYIQDREPWQRLPSTIIEISYDNYKVHQTIYKGCMLQNMEYRKRAGYDVPVYTAVFIAPDAAEADLGESENIIKTWAVGTDNVIEGIYSPFIDSDNLTDKPFVNENSKFIKPAKDDKVNGGYNNPSPEKSGIFTPIG